MSENTLNIIQINLRHSAAASAMLGHLILERNIGIILIQGIQGYRDTASRMYQKATRLSTT